MSKEGIGSDKMMHGQLRRVIGGRDPCAVAGAPAVIAVRGCSLSGRQG